MINRPGPGKVCGKGHRVASLRPRGQSRRIVATKRSPSKGGPFRRFVLKDSASTFSKYRALIRIFLFCCPNTAKSHVVATTPKRPRKIRLRIVASDAQDKYCTNQHGAFGRGRCPTRAPIRRICSGCRALAASGQATETAKTLTKSRRRTEPSVMRLRATPVFKAYQNLALALGPRCITAP